MNTEKQDAAVASVLGCLQTPVLCSEIQTQVEHNYLSAVRRYTGLCLLNATVHEEAGSSEYMDVAACLRDIQLENGSLKHYLDDIQGGCNQQIDLSIRRVMFEILGKLSKRLQVTDNSDEAFALIYALHWQYHARDFKELLEKLNIFPLLSGKELPDSLMHQAWGKLHTKHKALRSDLALSFTEVYLTILSRITDVSIDT